MKKNCFQVFIISAVLLAFCISCTKNESNDTLSSKTKIALRAVGNSLLLSQNDSTSLVLPVVEVAENSYHLSFEKSISFDPSMLHIEVSEQINKANLPTDYTVEVLQCNDGEVSYSYLITGDVKRDILPCGGRKLPETCYTIHFKYLKSNSTQTGNSPLFYVLVTLVFVFLILVFYSKYYAYKNESQVATNVTEIGIFYFYPDQHKLLNREQEIALSKKECELLEILSSNLNEVVKRETLIKQVWEDQGVIVGRSLDTYISKLRKKLQGDPSLKITNIHGVGYRLEMV